MLNLFLLLLAAGLAAIVVPKEKYDRFSAFVFWLAVSAMFYGFCMQWQSGTSARFFYRWIEYNALEVDIVLAASPFIYAAVFPVFLMTVSSLLINVFSKEETAKTEFVSASVFNLFFFIALICSENLIQLLICSAMISVAGFYLIHDFSAREKYVFYNFLADMGLFTVFAIIYGRMGNISLNELGKFSQSGAHRDLVAVLLLASVFMKSGLFLFHNQFLDLAPIPFNRILQILCASTPLAGVVILHKTMPLLSVSHYSVPVIQILSGASIVWGFVNSLVCDSIKKRCVYMSMMIYGYIYSLVSFGQLQTPEDMSPLIILAYVLGLNSLMIYLSSSNESYLSRMGGFLSRLKFTFLLSLIMAAVYILTVLREYNAENAAWNISLLACGIISLAHFYGRVFLGKSNADEWVAAMLKEPGLYVSLPFLAISYWLINPHGDFPQNQWYWGGVFILLLFLRPLRRLDALADYEAVQDEDYIEKFYELIILTPIRILGRVLWLLIDFILIERTLISSIHDGTGLLIRLSSKLNGTTAWSWLLLSLSGIAVMFAVYFLGE